MADRETVFAVLIFVMIALIGIAALDYKLEQRETERSWKENTTSQITQFATTQNLTLSQVEYLRDNQEEQGRRQWALSQAVTKLSREKTPNASRLTIAGCYGVLPNVTGQEFPLECVRK